MFLTKFYIFVNHEIMNKKEYVEKAKIEILSRVRFHAPIVYSSEVNKDVLTKHGIDVNLPIFKFEKRLTKNLFEAFKKAMQEEKFNLVLSYDCAWRFEKKLSRLKNVVLFSKFCEGCFLENINKLNINYYVSSNYDLKFNERFVKIGETVLNPQFEDFLLQQKIFDKDVYVEHKEFLLNGNNFYTLLHNNSDSEKKINAEINIPLQKGYYYFKRMRGCILIENLISKQIFYLNYVCKRANFSFSNVDGLKNSIFCCININITLKMQKNEKKWLFFNLGNAKFSPKTESEIKKMIKLSQKMCKEVFNVKVKTKNGRFDNLFNRILPQRIWTNWQNGIFEKGVEEKYLTYKRLFVKGEKAISFVNFKQIGLKELGIFNGSYYKKILIVKGDEKFLQVGKTHFTNINGVTNFSLKSKQPISLCFGI